MNNARSSWDHFCQWCLPFASEDVSNMVSIDPRYALDIIMMTFVVATTFGRITPEPGLGGGLDKFSWTRTHVRWSHAKQGWACVLNCHADDRDTINVSSDKCISTGLKGMMLRSGCSVEREHKVEVARFSYCPGSNGK